MPLSLDTATRSHRNHFVEPPGLMERLCSLLPSVTNPVVSAVRSKAEAIGAAYARERRRLRQHRRGLDSGRGGSRMSAVLGVLWLLFSLQNVLIGTWVVTLWWGERRVFREAVTECAWDGWERWPQGAVPHHTLLVADPQLVDAHTYPGRPWPLSTLTVYMADLYLYRTHSLLQEKLRPDSTFFLGDLFDGGREWGTDTSSSPDDRYKQYGNSVWMKEYRRFSRIFLDTFKLGGTGSAASPRGRKIIASLPGNHDLGFGNGIQLPVLQRFRAYFGEGNRIDIMGNHTFASVDSVTLSAMDQVDPATGSSSHPHSKEIWGPTETFLDEFKDLRSRRIREELLLLKGEPEQSSPLHGVTDAGPPANSNLDFPVIVLTHVPLYREAGTPCGPLREQWPPSSTDPLPEKDERNAIRIGAGYQYQNVLTPKISQEIVKKTGPVVQIYSGDDHDYCEITHREFTGAPKEITVKSTSFAMGVRRPGVQLVSLWNPVDPKTSKSIGMAGHQTIQNKLCLLPDQLSILIQYAYVFALTLLILIIRAILLTLRPNIDNDSSAPLLPLTNRSLDEVSSSSSSSSTSTTASSLSSASFLSTASSSSSGESRFSSRNGNSMVSRTASSSPSNDGTRPARYVHFGNSTTDDEKLERSRRDDWDISYKDKPWSSAGGGKEGYSAATTRRGFWRSLSIFKRHFVPSLKWVGGVSLAWYFWLLFTW